VVVLQWRAVKEVTCLQALLPIGTEIPLVGPKKGKRFSDFLLVSIPLRISDAGVAQDRK
jgi:hypothetical protein